MSPDNLSPRSPDHTIWHTASPPAARARLDLTSGRAVVTPPWGTAKVTHEDLRAALYD